MSENLGYLAGRRGLNYNLLEQLGIAAAETGTPDQARMETLRKEFLFGKGNVQGTVSFYDFLKEENKGKKVYVCNGSACLTAGTQPELREKLQKHFSADQIGEMCCLGRCHENAAFNLEGKNYSGSSIERISEIIDHKKAFPDQYHVASTGGGFLTDLKFSDQEIIDLVKREIKKDPEILLNQIQESNLRGRGGAGFPISFKLKACREASGKDKFIVCNADEGDPGAYSDRYLLEHRPLLVLAGMMLAGRITGANWGVLYIRAEYPESILVIENAIKLFKQSGLTGSETDFRFEFKIIRAQGAYICGEETALLSSIEGQRPEVRVRPPYPAQKGLFNQPTVVNNVETLANLPVIIKHGGKVFGSTGTTKSSGTKLISLDGFFNRPGIYEVDMGTSLQKVIDELGGGFRVPVKALHIGGPLGGLVPVNKINQLSIDFESFSQNGFLLGHASIICIPDSFPIIEYIEHLFSFTAHESCGKCFPCRIGSVRGTEMIHQARTGSYKIDGQLMHDLLETLESGSLCMLGGGLPLPVRNALSYFKEELKPYFTNPESI